MKILQVANISRHFIHHHTSFLKWLKDENHVVHVACQGTKKVPYINKQYNVPIQRTPYSFKNIIAFKRLRDIIKKEKYDIIHCHTPLGGVIGRLAASTINYDLKIIYTSHGFHFYKGAPLQNWILYYPVEKLMSFLTDYIITINKEDFDRAKKLHANEVFYIPSVGLNIDKFKNVHIDEKKKRKKLRLTNNDFVITSIGDLNKNKNHEVIVKSISKIEKNKNIKYIICGEAQNKKTKLERLIHKLDLEKNIYILGYREDINEILKISDCFVFPSLREGLGMAALEAMASKVPVITSNIHGINDYVINNITGLSCSPKNVDCFADSIKKIKDDIEFRKNLRQNAFNMVKKYSIKNSLEKQKKIYRIILNS